MLPDVTTVCIPTVRPTWHIAEVNADYYPCPLRMVSLLILTITYVKAMTLHVHKQGRFTDHTINPQLVQNTDHSNQCHEDDGNGKYCAQNMNQTDMSCIQASVLTIATVRFPDAPHAYVSMLLLASEFLYLKTNVIY